MFELECGDGPWRRVERRTTDGQVLDYVEVGACATCGSGVDRAFPLEYQLSDGTLLCLPCSQGRTVPAPASLPSVAAKTSSRGG